VKLAYADPFMWAVLLQLIESSMVVLYVLIVAVPEIWTAGAVGPSGAGKVGLAIGEAAVMLLLVAPAGRVLLQGYKPARFIGLLCVQIIDVLMVVPIVIGGSLWYLPLVFLNLASLVVLIAWRPLRPSAPG
jgi:hypothetical protein